MPSGAGRENEAVWVEEEVEIRRVGLPWGRISLAAVAGLVVILVIVWLVGLRGCSDRETGAPTEQAAHESLLSDPGPDASETGTVSDEPETVVDGDTEPNVPVTPPETAPRTNETTEQRPVVLQPARLPVALSGARPVPFGDGVRPLVLRLLCADPVGVRVACDSERGYTDVRWPRTADIEPLPAADIRAGRPYRTREGLVVYWGARDQFSLKLDRTSGVEITLNGGIRDVSDLKPGQEQILYLPSGR